MMVLVSRFKIGRKNKAIVKLFKKCKLSIVVDTNLRTVDFLDVTFDLDKNIYKLYRKPNNSPIYIKKNSKHPPKYFKTTAEINCQEYIRIVVQ